VSVGKTGPQGCGIRWPLECLHRREGLWFGAEDLGLQDLWPGGLDHQAVDKQDMKTADIIVLVLSVVLFCSLFAGGIWANRSARRAEESRRRDARIGKTGF